MNKKKNNILDLVIIILLIFIFLIEFQAYQKFYSGEHNIDLGYNAKGTTLKYDLTNKFEIVEASQLYISGGNQIRESLFLFGVSKLAALILGVMIGLGLKIVNNGSKNIQK